jgi:hypothetical protein
MPLNGKNFYASTPGIPYNLAEAMTKASFNTHLKLGLKHHEISLESKPFGESSQLPTPLEEFAARKMRYTVSINGNYQTRETTCGKFSSEIAAFMKDQRGILIGIGGVNGYKCRPTDEEILMWAHPLDPEDGNYRLVP